MSSSKTPLSSALLPNNNMYTMWGLDLSGKYKEVFVRAPDMKEVRKYFHKHFTDGVGGCCRGDMRRMVPEPGTGSGFIDAVCPGCNKKVSWFGTLDQPPPCRHCGKSMKMIDLTALRMKYLTEKCKYYESPDVRVT